MISPSAIQLSYVAVHTVVIYVLLIAGLRLVGRRQLGQLTVIDLVIVILMGSAVETAMVDGNTSLYAGLVSAGTLLVLNRAMALVSLRSRRIGRLIGGEPLMVVRSGHIIEEHLRRAGLTEEDLLEAIRQRGYCEIEELRYAVVETDGAINVVPKRDVC